MKSTNRSTATTTEPAPAIVHYISFNKDEWAALEKLGFRERWAYAQLKWLANFKTGMAGNYRKQKITYTSLAELVTAPGVQGRGKGDIEDTQAADFLKRMQAVGLVGSIAKRTNGGLIIELPLSPIDHLPPKAQNTLAPVVPAVTATPMAAISPDQTPQEAGFFPDEDVPPFDDISMPTRVWQPSPPSLSVMTLKESNTNTDEAPSADAEAASSSRATGAAPSRGFVSGTPSPAAPPANLPAMPTWERALSAQEIRADLASDWDWTDVDTLQAQSLYTRWALERITADRLFQAKAAAMTANPDPEHRHTPVELLAHLYANHPEGDRLAA